MTAASPGGNGAEIEVGASAAAGDLRYWKAREAVRQGEARLAAQAAIRTALEARATAITGWAATSLAVATAAVFAAPMRAARYGLGVTAALLFVAAGLCIYAARPGDWSVAGYDPQVITRDTLGTELEVLESVGSGISAGLRANAVRLDAMARLLRRSGWLLLAAPLAGAVAYSVIRAAT